MHKPLRLFSVVYMCVWAMNLGVVSTVLHCIFPPAMSKALLTPMSYAALIDHSHSEIRQNLKANLVGISLVAKDIGHLKLFVGHLYFFF